MSIMKTIAEATQAFGEALNIFCRTLLANISILTFCASWHARSDSRTPLHRVCQAEGAGGEDIIAIPDFMLSYVKFKLLMMASLHIVAKRKILPVLSSTLCVATETTITGSVIGATNTRTRDAVHFQVAIPP